jgi:hypothetical protein
MVLPLLLLLITYTYWRTRLRWTQDLDWTSKVYHIRNDGVVLSLLLGNVVPHISPLCFPRSLDLAGCHSWGCRSGTAVNKYINTRKCEHRSYGINRLFSGRINLLFPRNIPISREREKCSEFRSVEQK